jgi:hypothetical protein
MVLIRLTCNVSIDRFAISRSAVEFPSIVISFGYAFLIAMKFFAIFSIKSNRPSKLVNYTLIGRRRVTSHCLVTNGFRTLPISVQIAASESRSSRMMLFQLLLSSMGSDFRLVLLCKLFRIRHSQIVVGKSRVWF